MKKTQLIFISFMVVILILMALFYPCNGIIDRLIFAGISAWDGMLIITTIVFGDGNIVQR